MTEVIEKEEHFINGGSSIGRRKKCRGSLRMELPFWKIKDDTDDSKKGTKIHKGGEKLIPTALQNWNQEDKFEGAETLSDYDPDEIEGSQKYCLDILRIIGNKVPNIAWVSEQKFIIDEDLQLGGTADFAWGYMQTWSEFEAEHAENFPELIIKLRTSGNLKKDVKVGNIWDYKNGTIPHFAPTSDQIGQYASGLQNKLGTNGKRPFDVIFGYIYGPNFRDQSLVHSVVAYTAKEIDDILAEQVVIAEEALGLHGDGPLKLHAGEHCFFCKAKAVCGEFDRFTRSKAQLVLDRFDTVNVPAVLDDPAELENIDFAKVVATKTDDEVKEFFLHIEYFQKGINAVKEYIRMRHLQGKPISGLRCVEGTKRRKYKQELNDLQIGEQAQTWGIAKPWIKVARNFTDLEKELYKNYRAEKMPVEDAKKKAASMIAQVCDWTNPQLAIILDSENDPRPSIEVVNQKKANEVFGAVPLSSK